MYKLYNNFFAVVLTTNSGLYRVMFFFHLLWTKINEFSIHMPTNSSMSEHKVGSWLCLIRPLRKAHAFYSLFINILGSLHTHFKYIFW